MKDKELWDQIAVITTTHNGRDLTGTVVAADCEEFEVFPTMDHRRIVIAVPINMFRSVVDGIVAQIGEDEVNDLMEIGKSIGIDTGGAPDKIGRFVAKNPDRVNDGTFDGMSKIVDACNDKFREFFGIDV